MKEFKSLVANVQFDVDTLEFQDMNRTDISEPITLTSKSELFRYLYDAGLTIAEISKTCSSHYSFVYGVVSNSREMRKTSGSTASDEIRILAAQGMTVGEISKQLNKNYSFVFGVVKKYKASVGDDSNAPILSTTGLVVSLPQETQSAEDFSKLDPNGPDPDKNLAKEQAKEARQRTKAKKKAEQEGEVVE